MSRLAKDMIEKIRETENQGAEIIKKAEAEAAKRRAGYREEIGGGVRQQQVDEDLIL